MTVIDCPQVSSNVAGRRIHINGNHVNTGGSQLRRSWPLCGPDFQRRETAGLPVQLGGGKPQASGLGKPDTFTFLGFTFIRSKTRRGKFQIKRKSRRDRMRAKLQAIKQKLRRSMHQPIPQQGRWLQQVVTGYFNYHAVPTNGLIEALPTNPTGQFSGLTLPDRGL
jgi:hypothetical protein